MVIWDLSMTHTELESKRMGKFMKRVSPFSFRLVLHSIPYISFLADTLAFPSYGDILAVSCSHVATISKTALLQLACIAERALNLRMDSYGPGQSRTLWAPWTSPACLENLGGGWRMACGHCCIMPGTGRNRKCKDAENVWKCTLGRKRRHGGTGCTSSQTEPNISDTSFLSNASRYAWFEALKRRVKV